MRVLMVSKALVAGAYQRKLEELAALPGVELTVVVPPEWRDRRGKVRLQRAYVSNYELTVAPLAFNGQYHLHFYPTLSRIAARVKPDVLHMDEEPYNAATWHALRVGQTIGARSLFFTWQNLPRRYPWPFRHFEQANFRRASFALAGNQDAVGVLRGKGYQGAVAVIPQFGVDPELYTPGDPGRPRRSGYVIGYVGGLVPEKGVDLLLRACAGLAGNDWQLLIAGDGPERPQLTRLAEEHPMLRGRVLFLGQVPSTQTPDIYRQLDVLVLPSLTRPNWTEQFGRVLVEAMACGVPVIGSSAGEIPHVIGDAGLVFREGDQAALTVALAELAAGTERRARLAQLGRARVLAHFTQARIAAETYEVYRQMLAAS